MRISDWSSDVSSSDLNLDPARSAAPPCRSLSRARRLGRGALSARAAHGHSLESDLAQDQPRPALETGLADPHEHAQNRRFRSEEHTSELQSLMRISYAVFCLKKKHTQTQNKHD